MAQQLIVSTPGSADNAPAAAAKLNAMFTELYARPSIVGRFSFPSGKAPSGTVGANGALTLGTALPFIYGPTAPQPVAGIWLAFPVGACFAGSPAGSYWVVMISTTLGTIFNNPLVIPGPLTPPVAPVGIVDAGPGAYAGVTTEITLAGCTIPANGMGALGALRSWGHHSIVASTNAKTFRVRLNGISLVQPGTAVASQVAFNVDGVIQNCGRTDSQVGLGDGAAGAGGSAVNLRSSIDTTAAQPLTMSVTSVTATEYAILEAGFVELLPG